MSLEMLTGALLRLPPQPGSHPDMPVARYPLHMHRLILPQTERTEEALGEVWAEVLEFLRDDLMSGTRHDFLLEHGIEVVESQIPKGQASAPALGRWHTPIGITYLRGATWGQAQVGIFTDASQHRRARAPRP